MKNHLISILLLFVIQPSHTQNLECGVLSEVTTEGQRYITIYDENYEPVGELQVQNNALIDVSPFTSNQTHFYVYQSTTNEDVKTDLFRISGKQIISVRSISNREVQPRPNAWSYDGRYMILRTVGTNDDALIIYDTLIAAPIKITDRITDFSNVRIASWSPSQNFLAFIGFNRIVIDTPSPTENYGIHIMKADGSLIKTINVSHDSLARFQWLTGTLLAAETCDSKLCSAVIVDVLNGDQYNLETRNQLLEKYIQETGDYLLSNLDDRNLSVYSQGGVSQITFFDRIISRPVFSTDHRYVSFRAEIDGKHKLIIMQFSEPYEFTAIDLESKVPPLIRGNGTDDFDYIYNFNFLYDRWHPSIDQLLYEDNDRIYIYDAETSKNSLIIAHDNTTFTNPMWICQ